MRRLGPPSSGRLPCGPLVDVSTPLRQGTFIDVGARYYDTSCRWFAENFPDASCYKMIAFEVEPRFRVYFDSVHPEVELISKAVGTFDGHACFQFGMAHAEKHTVMDDTAAAGTESCGGTLTRVDVVDFAAFLKERVTKNEWVVAKIDVEGTECAQDLNLAAAR